MTISDRIAVMNRGRIEQLGRPEDVYERPATQFVAEFLGASNLLEGTLKGTDDGFAALELAGAEAIRIPAAAVRDAAGRVKVGIRPEKIEVVVAGDAPPAGHNVMSAVLRSAVFTGVSYQYFFETAGGRQVSAFDRNTGRGAAASPGEHVRLAWRPEHTFIVPAETDTVPATAQPSQEGEA